MSTDWVTVARSLARIVVYGDEIEWWHKSKEDQGNDQGCEGERFRYCSLATWLIGQVVALVSQRLAYILGIYTGFFFAYFSSSLESSSFRLPWAL